MCAVCAAPDWLRVRTCARCQQLLPLLPGIQTLSKAPASRCARPAPFCSQALQDERQRARRAAVRAVRAGRRLPPRGAGRGAALLGPRRPGAQVALAWLLHGVGGGPGAAVRDALHRRAGAQKQPSPFAACVTVPARRLASVTAMACTLFWRLTHAGGWLSAVLQAWAGALGVKMHAMERIADAGVTVQAAGDGAGSSSPPPQQVRRACAPLSRGRLVQTVRDGRTRGVVCLRPSAPGQRVRLSGTHMRWCACAPLFRGQLVRIVRDGRTRGSRISPAAGRDCGYLSTSSTAPPRLWPRTSRARRRRR